MNPTPPADSPALPSTNLVVGVRYSLPAMLAEIKIERTTGAYAMEKLDQQEIGRIFKPQKRRAKPQK